MNHAKFWLRFSSMVLITPLIGACVFSFPERHTRDSNVRIFHPQTGLVIPLAEITVSARVFHDGLEVAGIEFFANGESIGEVAPRASSEADYWSHGEIAWTPPELGEYMLQAQADMLEGADVTSEPVRVCVIGFEIEPGTYGEITGYEGPCDVPRSVRRGPGSGPITLAARAEPDVVIYNEHYESPLDCPEVANPSLAFVATVEDPPDDVLFVVVYYSMTHRPASPSAGESRSHPLVLTFTRLIEPSTEIYAGQTEPLDITLGNFFGGDGGTISWIARAISRDGRILQEVGPYTIEAMPVCPGTTPLILPIPATATATLEPSEANCPPGTYYAPVTNQCIAIEIKSPRPDQKCSDFGTLSSCTAAGCTWDGQSQSCK